MPTLASNKIAYFNYKIIEEYDAGLVLNGAEVKAVKQKKMSLKGAYITVENNEFWLKNCLISPYQVLNQGDYDPMRLRKILLKRQEIDSLIEKVSQIGLTLLPINVYTKKALVKIKIGLAQGKKLHDKRSAIKKRENDRNLRRVVKLSQHGDAL